MERKFMIYQRRDGFQIAEEATGIRIENGMEFLARPNKSAFWCTADFGIDLQDKDDGYELVGEEVIDCSRLPAQILCFVDGVMKVFNQSRIAVERMIEQCHAEALEMNATINAEKSIRSKLPPAHAEQVMFYAANDHAARRNIVEEAHAEALEMNKKCFELYYRYWRWWNVMDEYCRADDLALAHKQALKMNSSFKECA